MPERAALRVIRPGLLTTVQDLGRHGFRRYGMPVAGAMDNLALRIANRLVGNPDHAAGLEVTILGPELRFETDALIAITGADLSPAVDGVVLPAWTAVAVQAGSILTFGGRLSGARAYVALAGGLDVPLVFGSRSTHLRSRTGGCEGRALVKGDALIGGDPPADWRNLIGRSIPDSIRPAYRAAPIVRAVLGPQHDAFTAQAFETLVGRRYTVLPEADRMGYRLAGPMLPHSGPPDIVSDATVPGAIQVPANQQPILLMADCQTTGGYPKIAVVISADLPLAAQLMPGDTIGFSLVDVEEARAIARTQRADLDRLLPPVGNRT
jgi:antagonist of KipI